MPEFKYAKGRIAESIQFISQEIKEFEEEYINKTWQDYQSDTKLQKLMDRTVENILTALIEVCGTILTEEGISADSYPGVLKELGKLFGFENVEQDTLSKLAIQRNRLAHRYLNCNSSDIRRNIYMEPKLPSPLMGEGQGEGDKNGNYTPYLNPLPQGERKTSNG